MSGEHSPLAPRFCYNSRAFTIPWRRFFRRLFQGSNRFFILCHCLLLRWVGYFLITFDLSTIKLRRILSVDKFYSFRSSLPASKRFSQNKFKQLLGTYISFRIHNLLSNIGLCSMASMLTTALVRSMLLSTLGTRDLC